MENLESFFTASQQLRFFGISCLLGIPAGILYDLFRTFRMLLPHSAAAVAAEDILFFFIYGIMVMSFTVAAARSEFRFYFCIGNFLGFALYHFTVGNIITSVLKRIIIKTRKIMRAIFRPIGKKIVLICEKIHFFFGGTLQNILKNKKNAEIDLIEDADIVYNNRKDEKKDKRKNVYRIEEEKIQKS